MYLLIVPMMIFSLFAAHFTASVFARQKLFQDIRYRKRNLALDGIRGYLALAVFFHHYIITWNWKSGGVIGRPNEAFYQNLGKVGVAVFFMITGYLFISRLLVSNKVDWYKLYKSRVFRIYPLFCVVLTLMILVSFQKTGWQLDVSIPKLTFQILKWLAIRGDFINSYEDPALVIFGVHWSLRAELIFYLSLPLLFWILKSRLAITALSLAVIGLVFYPVWFSGVYLPYLFLFFVGGLIAYISLHLRAQYREMLQSNKVAWLVVVLMPIVLLYNETLSLIHMILIGIVFLPIFLNCSLFGLLERHTSLILGEISYSIYLLHGVVLYFLFTYADLTSFLGSPVRYYLFLPFVTALVVMVSCLSFRYIEATGMALGRVSWIKTRVA